MANTNPGGIGHVWIKKQWNIQGKPPYQTIVQETPRGKRVFIPATIDDNPILKQIDPTYEEFLKHLPTDSLRLAWWKGDFTVFSGQYFDLNEKYHAIEPFKIPLEWPIWGALDYGETHNTAFGLYTRDQRND